MVFLHPDKLVGITRAIHSRPVRVRPSIDVAAQRAIAQRPLVKGKPSAAAKTEPGLIENLAFHLRQEYEGRHLDRIARRVDQAVGKSQKAPATGAGKPKPDGQPTIVIAPQAPVPSEKPPRPIRLY